MEDESERLTKELRETEEALDDSCKAVAIENAEVERLRRLLEATQRETSNDYDVLHDENARLHEAMTFHKLNSERLRAALDGLLCEMSLEHSLPSYEVYQVTHGAVADARKALRGADETKI